MPEVHASVGRSADARVYVNVVNNNAAVSKYHSISIWRRLDCRSIAVWLRFDYSSTALRIS